MIKVEDKMRARCMLFFSLQGLRSGWDTRVKLMMFVLMTALNVRMASVNAERATALSTTDTVVSQKPDTHSGTSAGGNSGARYFYNDII